MALPGGPLLPPPPPPYTTAKDELEVLITSTYMPNYSSTRKGSSSDCEIKTEIRRKILKDLGPPRPTKTNWCAILLAFLSGVFFTLCSALVKGLKSIAPMELLVLRSCVQVSAMLPIVAYRGRNPFGPSGLRLLLVLQGIVGGLTLVLLFFSFRRLPLGDATSIIFSSPVFVLLLSFICLREPCGFFRTLVVFLLVTGVVLIAQPPLIFRNGSVEQYDGLGYLAAVCGALFTAINIVVMRRCKEVHYSILVLHFSIWSLLIAGILTQIHGPWTSGGHLYYASLVHWGLALLIGVTGLLGQVLLARALSMEGAGKVAVTRSLDIVLAFILQVAFWGEVPDWKGALGAVLVCVCVAAMGAEEQLTRAAATIP
ncbi:solute carrier family 35 member G1-like [Neocloeon triangulifer]|uniref:solute carrier family 35 member G1-like n=1 Tax=Neocloeon triangulifer TaxID=2078957 RepID=UPI00286ECE43|nr:solute carrier family 35 member G1-like [Neocloeon triangulifer]